MVDSCQDSSSQDRSSQVGRAQVKLGLSKSSQDNLEHVRQSDNLEHVRQSDNLEHVKSSQLRTCEVKLGKVKSDNLTQNHFGSKTLCQKISFGPKFFLTKHFY